MLRISEEFVQHGTSGSELLNRSSLEVGCGTFRIETR